MVTYLNKRAFLKRRRTWLGLALLACVLLATYAMLTNLGFGNGISEANGRRISVGMSRSEVEGVLGSPNPLPDLVQKREAFWDAHTHFGFRYAAVGVVYDAEDRVVNTRVRGSWRNWYDPSWRFWRINA